MKTRLHHCLLLASFAAAALTAAAETDAPPPAGRARAPEDFTDPLPRLVRFEVKGGEKGQRIRLIVNRWGGPLLTDEKGTREFRVSVVSKPAFIETMRWLEGPTLRFAADEWNKAAVLEFDAGPGEATAQARQDAEIVLKVEAVDPQTVPPSRVVKLPLLFHRGIQPEGEALVRAFPVKPDAPDRFPMEQAADHCALDATTLNEYDRIVVFFTPKRDLGGDYREEFRYRLKDGAGKGVADGDWKKLDAGEENPFAPVPTRPGSPGRLVVSSPKSLDLYEPGVYVLETVRLRIKRTVVASPFGQGQTQEHEEDGQWQEEGRFEVQDGRLHFQGFIAEPVKNQPMPRNDHVGVMRWSGMVSIEKLAVDHAKGTVELEVTDRYTPATRRDDGTVVPVNKEWSGRTRLALTYPQTIRPGRAGDMPSASVGRMGEKNVAEIGVDWTAEGNAHCTPNLLPITPIRQVPPSREPFDRKDGIKLLRSIFWPHTIGVDYWIPTRGHRPVFTMEEIFKSEVFGDPPRTLAWHFRDPAAIWVLPIRLVVSSDVKIYAYAVYGPKPGRYDGPQPARPPWAGPDSGGDGPIAHGTPNGDAPGPRTPRQPEPGAGTPGSPDGRTPATPGIERPRPDPAALDPDRDAKVAALIREWIGIAEPPENATIGANLHYTEWGVKVGTVPGGTITARAKPDAAAGRSPEAYCWSVRKSLDSVNHCTLEGYVLARLEGRGTQHCVGRYKRQPQARVGDYVDRPADAARSEALLSGLKVAMTLGSTARSLEKAFTVERQQPPPGRQLDVGSEIRLTVRRKPAVVPNVLTLSARDARRELTDAGLEVRMSVEGNAPTAEEVHCVRRQEPTQGTVVKPGTVVRLAIYGPVRTACTVPNCLRIPLAKAQERVRQAGLRDKPVVEGAAPTRTEQGMVWKQDPLPDSEVVPGTVVRLYIYGPVRTARTVPNCLRTPLAKAQERVREAGLKDKPVVEGAAPTAPQQGMVWKQDPLPDAEVVPGTVVRLYIYGPVRTARTVPNCLRIPLAKAQERVREAGLACTRVTERAAPAAPQQGMVWKQDPQPDAQVLPGTVVRLYIYGPVRTARPPRTVPNCLRDPLAKAQEKVRQAGLRDAPVTQGAAPTPPEQGLVWKQDPPPNARVVPGTAVQLFAYGPPARRPDDERQPTGEAVWRLQKIDRLHAVNQKPVRKDAWIGDTATGRYTGSLNHWWYAPGLICFRKKTVDRGTLFEDWQLRCEFPQLPTELRAGARFTVPVKGTAKGQGQWKHGLSLRIEGRGITVDPAPHTLVVDTARRQGSVDYKVAVAAKPAKTITIAIGVWGGPAYVLWTYGKVAADTPRTDTPGTPGTDTPAQRQPGQRPAGQVTLPKTVPFPQKLGLYADSHRTSNDAILEKAWHTTNCYIASRTYGLPGARADTYISMDVYFQPRGAGPVADSRGGCPLTTPRRRGQGGPRQAKGIFGLHGPVSTWRDGEYITYFSSTHNAAVDIGRRKAALVPMQQLYLIARFLLVQAERYAEPLGQ